MANNTYPVRFLDSGGHDSGTGAFDAQPGQSVLLSKSRFDEIAKDEPGAVLRSPWGTRREVGA